MIWITLMIILTLFIAWCEVTIALRLMRSVTRSFDHLLSTPDRIFTNPPSQRVVRNGETTKLLSN